MKLKVCFLLAALAVLTTGCVGLHTLSAPGIANSPAVSLSQNNFHVVKHVQSTAKTTYVLGIGGFSSRALRQNAVADMMVKANLQGSQAVINITSKVSRKFVTPLFVRVRIDVYGTVVEFDGPSYVNAAIVPEEKLQPKANYTPASKPVEVKVADAEPYVAPVETYSSTPLDLCRTGEIRTMPKKEQKAVLSMLVEMLDDQYRNANTIDELKTVESSVLVVKTHYGLMANGTQEDIDKLYSSIQKKLRKVSKK